MKEGFFSLFVLWFGLATISTQGYCLRSGIFCTGKNVCMKFWVSFCALLFISSISSGVLLGGRTTLTLAHCSSSYCLLGFFSGWMQGQPPSQSISLQCFPYWQRRASLRCLMSRICYATLASFSGWMWQRESTSIFLGVDQMSSDCDYSYLLDGRVTASKMTEGWGQGATVQTSEMASHCIGAFLVLFQPSMLSFTLSIHPCSPLKFFNLHEFL